MKMEFVCEREIDGGLLPSVKFVVVAVLIAFVVTDVWVVTLVAHPRGTQERSANKQEQTAQEEKKTPTVIAGIVVNQRGMPVKGQALELYMVVNGIARDAYGAPLKGAVTVGPNRQILGMLMFPVKSETDATGRFSMELPKYMLTPSGVEMTGWTIVSDASGKVRVLSIKGEMATIVPKPDSNKIDLGKLTLSPQPVGEK